MTLGIYTKILYCIISIRPKVRKCFAIVLAVRIYPLQTKRSYATIKIFSISLHRYVLELFFSDVLTLGSNLHFLQLLLEQFVPSEGVQRRFSQIPKITNEI